MTPLLKRTLFNITFLFVTLLFSIPILVLKEYALTVVPGPDGIYRGGDGLLPGLLAAFLAMILADRLVSTVFWKLGFTEDRWSAIRRPR